MPYKSRAQARLFHAKQRRGEISAKTVKEFDRSTKFSSLPEHVKKKKRKRKRLLGKRDDYPE